MRFTQGIMAVGRGTVPVLSSVSSVFSDTFAWLKATTDTGSGTLYGVVVPSAASAPSGPQIEAGQDGSGAAATAAANVAITSGGAKTLLLHTFTAATAYKIYATHKVGSLYSAVVNVAFTSDTLVRAAATDGSATNLGASTGCAAFSGANLNRSDPFGGTNAVRFMDINDSVSGAITMNLGTFNYFVGVNKFFFTKKLVSGMAWERQQAINITTGGTSHWNVSTGALGGATGSTAPREVFDMGSGWFMHTHQTDMTGAADVNGSFSVSKASVDNSAAGGLRDGSHQTDFYNMRITHP